MCAQNVASSPANWYEDPLHRHEFRYWDGSVWTEHVADQGRASVDAIPAPSRAEGVVAEDRVNRTGSDQSVPESPQSPSKYPDIISVYRLYDSFHVVVDQCPWDRVPAQPRAVWEAALVEGEVPQICSWAGALLTDHALLLADQFPAGRRYAHGTDDSYKSIGRSAKRYELTGISDVHEGGFRYQGARKWVYWAKGDQTAAEDGFLWLFLQRHPELAPKLVLQDSERRDPSLRRVVARVSHLTSASASATAEFFTTQIQTTYETGSVQVVLRESGSKGLYFVFVRCPFCSTDLRLSVKGDKFGVGNRGLVSVVGAGGPSIFVDVHRIAIA